MEEIRFELDCDAAAQHLHNELEIMYVLSGRIAIVQTGRNIVLEPEDIIVFNPFEHHEIYRESGNHTLSAYIPVSVLQQADLGNIQCCSHIQKEYADYFLVLNARLAVLFKNYMNEADFQRSQILSQMFGLLAVLKQQFEVPVSAELKGTFDRERLRKVLIYVQEHFSEDISIQDVADQVYLSKGHLSREFQRQMGISFSDYLRKLRLSKASYLLRMTSRPVMEVALECGFSNVNTMIINFRKVYGETPNVYRKKHQNPEQEERIENDTVSYMSLLKYAQYEEKFYPLNKKQQRLVQLKTNICENRGIIHLCHSEAVSIGWAKGLLLENIRNAVRRSVSEIGFKYIHFRGMLDDSLDVYHENADGEPYLSFTYIDMIFDFLLSLGVKLWVEFSYTPRRMVSGMTERYGDSCIDLPEDLGKWSFLIESVMKHFIDRYGVEECKKWRYSAANALYSAYGFFSMEDYLEYYRVTYAGIRKQLEDACIAGCAMDTGYIVCARERELIQFMDYCLEHNCMPDEFTFQCLHSDYSKENLQNAKSKILVTGGRQPDEPIPVSENPDVLAGEIACIRNILDAHGGAGRQVIISSWNSTFWNGDLGNDTCFKAAFIFKNFLENAGKVNGMVYCFLTDNSERWLTNVSDFFGGVGLMTYLGLPKAGYYAYMLLNRLDVILLAQGDGYTITRSKDRKKIQIALYHYCHYNSKTHIRYSLSIDEQRTCDRYYGFADSGVKSYRFYFEGLIEGFYDKESYSINRKHGNSYDNWMSMGAPKVIAQEQRDYLERISAPEYHYERLRVDKSGELLISAVLDAHEVRVICVTKK